MASVRTMSISPPSWFLVCAICISPNLPIYRESLPYLLKSQLPDGKWGNYERHRGYYGDYVNQAFYLHTTLVVVDALTTAFYFRER